MRNLLRRLHLGPNQEDHTDHSIDGASNSRTTSPSKSHSNSNNSNNNSTNKSRTRLSIPEAASGLLTVARNTISQSSNHLRLKKDTSSCESQQHSSHNHSHNNSFSHSQSHSHNRLIADLEDASASASVDSLASSLALDAKDSSQNGGIIGLERTQTSVLQYYSDQALMLQDEDLQVKVAMALSVRDDPEAAAIEAAKDLTRDSTPPPNSLTAEMLAYQYWKQNVLNYDDKVPDGFYDVYGVAAPLHSEMPALIDLQEAPVSEKMTSEVILVNRATDNDLVILEQKAVSISLSSRVSLAGGWKKSGLINRLANLVVDQMGGPVHDYEVLHKRWRTSIMELRFSLGNSVLPLGCLHIGLERHRALLFKVLADAAGLPCRLVKGRQYTDSDERVVIIVKADGGREYVVDLMLTPGKLVPFDQRQFTSAEPLAKQDQTYSNSVTNGSTVANNQKVAAQVNSTSVLIPNSTGDPHTPVLLPPLPPLTNRSGNHWRSPSWTEGITSQVVRDTKVKDVSQYMMNAAKENPMLAKKLHDFLIESGVQAPPELFSELSPKQLETHISGEKKKVNELQGSQNIVNASKKDRNNIGPGRPPAPPSNNSASSEKGSKDRLLRLNSVEGLGDRRPLDISTVSHSTASSPNSSDSSCNAPGQSSTPGPPLGSAASLVQENIPPELVKHVPVAAAAAATAAVVASSMVVAASKSDLASDPTLEVPVAAAATATAAVVVATSAVVGKRLEMPIPEAIKGNESDKGPEEERISDKSSGSCSAKSDHILDDAAEWEIPWEDLSIGERIGLGSYGEVYRAEWHGTEVAVKKFLDQDLSGDALEEFRTEVRLMKRMRHPNVVLFMGAVMRAPNLSIVTEFLPRGSLYRLIHRANNQLDERRRLRMALDIARGMNYLHNCTPVIVHRDLKSPNLLVDKNWVVKVCDFGLSRMKHNTFLSSKSAVGTPEWMAPEVLRNEPSNEKADVYSFGVILWELATLQQPWAGMNPMQVVGAVGFQYRTLDIPDDLDPALVKIIKQCWQRDPAARPSFAEIMAALKPLQKPITAQAQKSC